MVNSDCDYVIYYPFEAMTIFSFGKFFNWTQRLGDSVEKLRRFFLVISPRWLMVSCSWHPRGLIEMPLMWFVASMGRMREKSRVTSLSHSLILESITTADLWLPCFKKKSISLDLESSGRSCRG